MDTVEYGHFLLDAINNAEDISLFLGTYNACLTDDVLRGSAAIDDRPLVVFGSDKRHAMCKKKLPMMYGKSGIDYNESLVTFVTVDTLQDFVTEALANLKSGMPVEVQEEVVTQQSNAEVAAEVIEQEYIQPQVIAVVESQEVVSTKPEIAKEPEINKVVSEQSSPGICTYGVPKLKVEYLPPNVMGLQESLFINVSDADISKFFGSVRNRVLGSIDNDN